MALMHTKYIPTANILDMKYLCEHKTSIIFNVLMAILILDIELYIQIQI